MQLSSSLVLVLFALALAASPLRAADVSAGPAADSPVLETRSGGTIGIGKGFGTGLGGFYDGVGTGRIGGFKGGRGRHGLKFKNKLYHHANAIHHNAHAAKVNAVNKVHAAAAKSIAHHHHNYKARVKVHKEHFHAGFGGRGGKGKFVHRSVGFGNFGGKGAGFGSGFGGSRLGYGGFGGKGVGLGGGRLGYGYGPGFGGVGGARAAGFAGGKGVGLGGYGGYGKGLRVDHDRVVKVKKVKHHNNNDRARAAAKVAAANAVHAAAAHQNLNHADVDAKQAHKFRAGGRGKF